MNIKQIEKLLTDAGIEQNEAKIEAKMLAKHYLRLTDVALILNEEFKENIDLLEAIKTRAEKRFPIQHVIGTAYFMGEDFIVNEHVLIPRDETEILVRKAIDIINSEAKYNKVLDIGTGSGCIACTIAKHTEAQVIGIDVSTEALQIALDNASKLGLYNKAIFRKSDIFSNVKEGEKFDIIISNPPYIPISEKENLQIEVKFEPEGALFASDVEGIEFYDKIVSQAMNYLNKGGYLMFELGIGQAKKVNELMKKAGFINVSIDKDLAGIDRIIVGKK